MLTKQEMMDRAVRGLASQGFKKCLSPLGKYAYKAVVDGKEMHCAWGWVDPTLDESLMCVVYTLKDRGIGLAKDLDEEGLVFARKLQKAHDYSEAGEGIVKALTALCKEYNLICPKELQVPEFSPLSSTG